MAKLLGKKLRELRESKDLLLRQVAPLLEIDTPHLSKIERGERNLRKELLPILSKLYDVEELELQVLWLADHVMEVVEDEPTSIQSLQLTIDTLVINGQ